MSATEFQIRKGVRQFGMIFGGVFGCLGGLKSRLAFPFSDYYTSIALGICAWIFIFVGIWIFTRIIEWTTVNFLHFLRSDF